MKIHSSRTGLEPTTSMAPTRLAMQGGHAIHYTISPSPVPYGSCVFSQQFHDPYTIPI